MSYTPYQILLDLRTSLQTSPVFQHPDHGFHLLGLRWRQSRGLWLNLHLSQTCQPFISCRGSIALRTPSLTPSTIVYSKKLFYRPISHLLSSLGFELLKKQVLWTNTLHQVRRDLRHLARIGINGEKRRSSFPFPVMALGMDRRLTHQSLRSKAYTIVIL